MGIVKSEAIELGTARIVPAAGGSSVVGSAGANTGVAMSNVNATVASKTLSVAAGDRIEVEIEATLLNNTGVSRVIYVVFTLGGVSVEMVHSGTTGPDASSRSICIWRGVWTIASASDVLFLGRIQKSAVIAAGTTTSSGFSTQDGEWSSAATDVTGSVACEVAVRSDSAAATQTCYVHGFRITQSGAV